MFKGRKGGSNAAVLFGVSAYIVLLLAMLYGGDLLKSLEIGFIDIENPWVFSSIAFIGALLAGFLGAQAKDTISTKKSAVWAWGYLFAGGLIALTAFFFTGKDTAVLGGNFTEKVLFIVNWPLILLNKVGFDLPAQSASILDSSVGGVPILELVGILAIVYWAYSPSLRRKVIGYFS